MGPYFTTLCSKHGQIWNPQRNIYRRTEPVFVSSLLTILKNMPKISVVFAETCTKKLKHKFKKRGSVCRILCCWGFQHTHYFYYRYKKKASITSNYIRYQNGQNWIFGQNYWYLKNYSTDHKKTTEQHSIWIKILHALPNVQLVWYIKKNVKPLSPPLPFLKVSQDCCAKIQTGLITRQDANRFN